VSHSSRKLTPFGRELLIQRVQAGTSLRAAAATLGISASWAHALWHRFLTQGALAFAIRSSRPRRSPRRTPASLERRIERARRRRGEGPLRLSWLLGIARSTIYAVLRRLGLGRRSALALPRPQYRRYERRHPGELVHIDSKKLGRLGRGGGKRFGRTRPSQQRGWEYLHAAVDDRTRLAYVERLASDRAPDAAAFLVRAVAHFAGLGIRVRAVMTDNYWSYTKSPRYRAALQSLGLRHLVIPRYTPRINGKVEAFIGVLLREWAYARPYVDNRARSIALHHFVAHYTHRRPHGGLGGLTPMQRLTQDVHNVRGQYS